MCVDSPSDNTVYLHVVESSIVIRNSEGSQTEIFHSKWPFIVYSFFEGHNHPSLLFLTSSNQAPLFKIFPTPN